MGQQLSLFAPGGPAPRQNDLPFPRPAGAEGLEFCVLGSGSRGNSVVVRAGGNLLLLDAGFACRTLERKLRAVGVDPTSIGALVLTHEHGDHTRGAAHFCRRFRTPLFASVGTLRDPILRKLPAQSFRAGETVLTSGFSIETLPIPHDAREPVGLLVESAAGGARLALVADLGMRTAALWRRLHEVDALLLETNYDQDMLQAGPYPLGLKRRIAGSRGHLSNEEAAAGVPELLSDRLREIVLYHLSETNNRPEIAADQIGEVLARYSTRVTVTVTSQGTATPWRVVHPSIQR